MECWFASLQASQKLDEESLQQTFNEVSTDTAKLSFLQYAHFATQKIILLVFNPSCILILVYYTSHFKQFIKS
jgi:hypothetical protein